jgi:hypothetical protein
VDLLFRADVHALSRLGELARQHDLLRIAVGQRAGPYPGTPVRASP